MMNNTYGFPNNLFFQSSPYPFAYHFAQSPHSTTNIYWCYPELFYNVVYPNSQIFLNNSTNSIVVTPPQSQTEEKKVTQEEKPPVKKEEKKKEVKDTKMIGRKKRRVTKMCTACPHKYAMHYAKHMCSNCHHAKGRSKKPWNCPHVNKSHYALGLCQNCYQMNYIKKQSEIDIESLSKGSKKKEVEYEC